MNDDTKLTQLAENHRFYGDMRFKQLTLFMAAMTTAGAGVIQFPGNRWWIALGALFVAAVMWVIEVRAVLNGIAARKAIPEQFPSRPTFWPWINASWVVLLLHVACYAVWLWCIRIWCPTCCSFYIGVFVGIMLLIFSVVNYGRQSDFWLNRLR